MNDTRNRDLPARGMTKLEAAALALYANSDMTSDAAVRCAHALFDELEAHGRPIELRDEHDFDHEGTP